MSGRSESGWPSRPCSPGYRRPNDPAELSKVIRNFLGDCLSISGASLTTTELLEALDKAGVGADLRSEYRDLLQRCDNALYRLRTQSTSVVSRNG